MHAEIVAEKPLSPPGLTELLLCGLVCLAVVAWGNHGLLDMPPVWDATAGVFAPAIFLYESGFDFQALLAEPGYISGGANVHSTSLITWLTALVFWLTGGQTEVAFPILHMIQFAFSSLALTAVYALSRISAGRMVSGLLVTAVWTLPVFFVQSGYVYTEVPGSALTLLSLLAWVWRYHITAIVCVFLACAVKSLGLPMAVALAILMSLDSGLSKRSRMLYVGLLAMLVGGLETYKWIIRVGDTATVAPRDMNLDGMRFVLEMVPDVYALILVGLAWAVFFLFKLLRQGGASWSGVLVYLGPVRQQRGLIRFVHAPALMLLQCLSALVRGASSYASSDQRGRSLLGATLYMTGFLSFIVALVLNVEKFYPLIRYYVWVLPLSMLLSVEMVKVLALLLSSLFSLRLQGRVSESVAGLALVCVIGVSVLNREGVFYTTNGLTWRSFTIIERSLAYLRHYDVLKRAAFAVQKHDHGLPVFATRAEFYLLSHPLMGYVQKRIEDVRFVLQEPFSSGDLRDYPAEFMLLDRPSFRLHGQDRVDKILRQAKGDPRYELVVVESYTDGPYEFVLYRITNQSIDHPRSKRSSACTQERRHSLEQNLGKRDCVVGRQDLQ